MAVDKEANSLSRVYSYYSNSMCSPPAFFFRGTHKVRDDLQLSHFVG